MSNPNSHFFWARFAESRDLNQQELEELGDDYDQGEDEENYEEIFNLGDVHHRPVKRQKISLWFEDRGFGCQLESKEFVWTYSWLRVLIEIDKENLLLDSANAKIRQCLERNAFRVAKYELVKSHEVIPKFLDDLWRFEKARDLKFKLKRSLEEKYQKSRENAMRYMRYIDETHSLYTLENDVKRIRRDHEGLAEFFETFTQAMESTLVGGILVMATFAPNAFAHLPVLTPNKVNSIAEITFERKAIFTALEAMASDYPWKFAFEQLVRQCLGRFGKSGFEAPVKKMLRASFEVRENYRDLIFFYDYIKFRMAKEGHTCFVKEKSANDDLNVRVAYERKPHQDWRRERCKENRRQKTKPNIRIKDLAPEGEEEEEEGDQMELEEEEEVLEVEEIFRIKDTEVNNMLCILTEWGVLDVESVRDLERYHIHKYLTFDTNIVSNLSGMRDPEVSLSIDLDGDPAFVRLRQDPEQLQAARMILRNRFTVISGSAGTGKTMLVVEVCEAIADFVFARYVLADLCDREAEIIDLDVNDFARSFAADEIRRERKVWEFVNGPIILYAAPTGKAAGVIRKRTGGSAFTAHHIIRSGYETLNRYTNQMRVFVVDESSMMDTELMSSLLKIMTRMKRDFKVVFVGDVHQLPAIKPGNFLPDIFKVGIHRGFAVELKTNHRANAQLLFDNAVKLTHQIVPQFDPAMNYSFISVEPPFNPFLEHVTTRDDWPRITPRNLRFKFPPPEHLWQRETVENNEKKVLLVLNLLKNEAYRKHYGLESHENSQIVTLTNQMCAAVNEICCEVYANHAMHSQEFGRRRRKVFQKGDKIMTTKNSKVVAYKRLESGDLILDAKTQIFNGNIYFIRYIGEGYVIPDGKSKGYLALDDLNSSECLLVDEVDFRAKGKPTHAWACTIHKAQGSETDNVLYILAGFENWRHAYTAVTRAKSKVVILGTSYAEMEKIMKQRVVERYTALKDKLIDAGLSGMED